MQPTLPWTWYSDPDVLRREHDHIFLRSWQYVGHAGQAAEPGSYFTASLGLAPVVVTRAQDGELRAFLNVCRHRGFVVADGEGRRETLQCRYHAWTYELDGRLRTAPRSDREPGFDPEELSARAARGSRRGARSCSSTPTPTRSRSPTRSAPFPRSSPRSSTWTRWSSGSGPSSRSRRTGRSPARTSSSATTAPSRIRGSRRPSTSRRTRTGSPRSGLTSSQFGPLRTERDSFLTGGEVGRSQFHFLWPSFGINVFPGTAEPLVRADRAARPGAHGPLPRLLLRTGRRRGWVEELIAFDDQIGHGGHGARRGRPARPPRRASSQRAECSTESEQLVAHFQRLCGEALGE